MVIGYWLRMKTRSFRGEDNTSSFFTKGKDNTLFANAFCFFFPSGYFIKRQRLNQSTQPETLHILRIKTRANFTNEKLSYQKSSKAIGGNFEQHKTETTYLLAHSVQ